MSRKQSFGVLLASLMLVCASLVAGQERLPAGPKTPRTDQDYKRRTLEEIVVKSADNTRLATEAEVLTGDLMPSRVLLTIEGSERSLSPGRRNVIAHWAQRFAGDPLHYTAPYVKEMVFRESGVAHTLVVHNDLIPRLKEISSSGKEVDLKVLRLGAFKTKDEWNWVLLVEGFIQP